MTRKKVTTNVRARERKQRVTYSDDLLSTILDRVASGESLVAVCSADGMPSRKAFFDWVAKEPSIKDRYEVALSMRADKLAEDILALADICRIGEKVTTKPNGDVETVTSDMVERARLQIDARKWLAGKMAPKKYGDKIAVGGADDLPPIRTAAELTDAQLAAIAAGQQLA